MPRPTEWEWTGFKIAVGVLWVLMGIAYAELSYILWRMLHP